MLTPMTMPATAPSESLLSFEEWVGIPGVEFEEELYDDPEAETAAAGTVFVTDTEMLFVELLLVVEPITVTEEVELELEELEGGLKDEVVVDVISIEDKSRVVCLVKQYYMNLAKEEHRVTGLLYIECKNQESGNAGARSAESPPASSPPPKLNCSRAILAVGASIEAILGHVERG